MSIKIITSIAVLLLLGVISGCCIPWENPSDQPTQVTEQHGNFTQMTGNTATVTNPTEYEEQTTTTPTELPTTNPPAPEPSDTIPTESDPGIVLPDEEL